MTASDDRTSIETSNPVAIKLGLMTSLPLYWPLGVQMGELASGQVPVPWQRTELEARYAIDPLDTLSPVPSFPAGGPDRDPLAGLNALAIIQPRGLSPADNVALDQWVRGGGRLLLMLDPALTGEYDLPLGDPRRPVDTALIPPVVARWGLAISFDDTQAAVVTTTSLDDAPLPLALSGTVAIIDPEAARCTVMADGAAARCAVGKGMVTLIADAAVFEHEELGRADAGVLRAIVSAAIEA
ncbi:hypothetical protein [Erythrobacter sp. R86502]|uniref:Gldg family protein n=1 Tax=Erythrobacter sp. R86502 TaxID=3093846 RepID=UPI0036D3BF9B